MASKDIIIRGARENNLQNIDITIPKEKLVVFTGVSGSGKSTLAFDTIFSEGQRRYMESLSSYARQFLGNFEKPDVDSIEGLSPSIAIDQKTTSHNPRSTVGTVTEIYEYFRLLYARIGVAYCPTHNEPIVKFTPTQMVNIIKDKPLGSKIYILSPIVNNEKGTHKDTLAKFQNRGFERVRIDKNEIYRFSELPPLDKNIRHTIDIVVDRLILKEDSSSRLFESIETALDIGDGYVIIKVNDEEIMFSEHQSCKYCGFTVPPLEPRLFSFNSPLGCCPDCRGLGIKREPSVSKLVPNENFSINQGAIVYYKNIIGSTNIEWQEFEYLCSYYGIPMDVPFKKLTKEQKEIIYYGAKTPISFTIKTVSGNTVNRVGVEGIITKISRLYNTTSSDMMREYYGTFMEDTICPTCKGARLSKEVLAVKVGGLNIYELTCLSLVKLKEFFTSLKLTPTEKEISNMVI